MLVVAKAQSTRHTVEGLMKRAAPTLTYHEDMPADSFAAWQKQMSEAMARIMKHPEAEVMPPVKALERRRDGYTIEKWISYPVDLSLIHI